MHYVQTVIGNDGISSTATADERSLFSATRSGWFNEFRHQGRGANLAR